MTDTLATMTQHSLPFSILSARLAVGEPAPPSWQSITKRPLLVIVGVTGVGKSTTLAQLAELGLRHTLLPDRRVLTDALIISTMQAVDDQPIQPISDRKLRFEYTRRYRDLHPGGMAHALAQLLIEDSHLPGLLIFDGLRGDNEIEQASLLLPHACFVMLDAPDAVRVQRLLGRQDSFDQIGAQGACEAEATDALSFAALGVAEAAQLFSNDEQRALLALVAQGSVSAQEMAAKLRIVVEERRNYDPAATRRALLNCAAERSLIIDTTHHSAKAVAQMILDQLQSWGFEA
jgi:hypothetical protein